MGGFAGSCLNNRFISWVVGYMLLDVQKYFALGSNSSVNTEHGLILNVPWSSHCIYAVVLIVFVTKLYTDSEAFSFATSVSRTHIRACQVLPSKNFFALTTSHDFAKNLFLQCRAMKRFHGIWQRFDCRLDKVPSMSIFW